MEKLGLLNRKLCKRKMVDENENEDGDDYRFLKLKDAATCLNQRVSFIGVIFEFGFPRRSRGSDYFVIMKLIDESYPIPGMTVNIYARDPEKLPLVASPGDIALLSHVEIKPNGKEGVYAVYNKRYSSFALFKGIDGDEDFVPYQISSDFLSNELDKKFIKNLRKWLVNIQLGAGNPYPKDFSCFQHIKRGESHEFVAKILHKCEVVEDEWIIFIWDGTCAPNNDIETKLEDEMNNPISLQREAELLPLDVLRTFPTYGTVLRVIIDEGNKNWRPGFLKTGQWVNFQGIVCEVHDGLWYGVLMPTAKLRYIIPQNHRKSKHPHSSDDPPLSLKPDPRTQWAIPEASNVTVVDPEAQDASFVSLMDVITYHTVIAKFRCYVRVVAVFPWPPEEFVAPNGVYRLRLTLEDPTARIHAYLYAEDGDKFFDRSTPADVLRTWVNKLMGIDENKPDVRRPPVVQCCLKSYYLNKKDPWVTRKYRIFATRLV